MRVWRRPHPACLARGRGHGGRLEGLAGRRQGPVQCDCAGLLAVGAGHPGNAARHGPSPRSDCGRGVRLPVTGEILRQTKEKMDKAIGALAQDLATVRAGRAHPALLERIRADYYGTPTPLHQVASITASDARTILLQVWDKSAVSAVEKAILKSDLGLMPQVDGSTIRLNLPQLSAERRSELVRHVRKLGEDQRVVVRNLRRDGREQMDRQEKAGGLSADQVKRGADELQKLTDRAMEQIAQLVEGKEREITAV